MITKQTHLSVCKGGAKKYTFESLTYCIETKWIVKGIMVSFDIC